MNVCLEKHSYGWYFSFSQLRALYALCLGFQSHLDKSSNWKYLTCHICLVGVRRRDAAVSVKDASKNASDFFHPCWEKHQSRVWRKQVKAVTCDRAQLCEARCAQNPIWFLSLVLACKSLFAEEFLIDFRPVSGVCLLYCMCLLFESAHSSK